MGGTRHAINGPAAAMAFIVAGCVSQFGLEVRGCLLVSTHATKGLLVATLGAGLLQMTTGILGLGISS